MLRDEANWEPEIIKGIIEDALLMWSILFKGQGVAEEKEVRSVVFIPKSNSTKIEYRTSNAFIIPYINLKIKKDILMEFVLDHYASAIIVKMK